MANSDVSAALTHQIATRDRTYLSFSGMTMWLPNPDPILKAIGRDITVYRDMLSDALVGGLARRRRAAVLGMEHGVDRGDSSARVFKGVQTMLGGLDMRQVIRDLHNAAWYGYQPAEITWSATGGRWLPQAVTGKPPEWFLFDTENRLRFRSNAAWEGELLPERKFLLATNDATYDNPYGMPELSRVFWPLTFKKGGLKFWLRFADKFGQGFFIGKHPRGTPQSEIDALLDALEQLTQDGVGAIPDDSSVNIIESGGKSASSDLFQNLVMYCRSEINIALLGQNQNTEASSTHASAKAGNTVAEDIRDGDAAMVASPVNQLIRWYVDLNHGPDEPAPVWSMWEQESVDEVQAGRDEKLKRAGANFTTQYFKRNYGLKDGDLVESTPSDAPPGLSFAEPGEGGDYADLNTERLAREAQPQLEKWIMRVRSVMGKATSLPDLESRLLAEFSELPVEELTQVMSMAFSAATLAGRATVMDEGQ